MVGNAKKQGQQRIFWIDAIKQETGLNLETLKEVVKHKKERDIKSLKVGCE